MQRTDAGKPRKAVREEAEEKPRVPFDPRAAAAAAPPMPSDGSFQGSGGSLLLQGLQWLDVHSSFAFSYVEGACSTGSQQSAVTC